MQEELNVPGVTVQAEICSSVEIGPYFFEGTVNSEKQRDVLKEVVVELDNSPVFEGIRKTHLATRWRSTPL